MNKIAKLLEVIPEEQQELRDKILVSENLQESLMAAIAWPTDQWHWDALSIITGKPYEVLRPEMEPHD
jgi:hypothetical protein